MYKTLTHCRSCGNDKLVEAFDLGLQPLANDFAFPGSACCGYAPLKVNFCEQCTMSQLSVVVDPKIIYSNYPYVTSRSKTMENHFENLWRAINDECKASTVIEIGSNDGLFLQFCKDRGTTTAIGVDPAENLRPSLETGIWSVCSLFDQTAAHAAHEMARGSADVIVARHVFAHIDDIRGFVKNLAIMSHKETLTVIEVPYVVDLLNGAEFDTIYHEHLSYISLKSVEWLLRGTPFHIHKVIRFSIHCGAIAIMLRHNDSKVAPDSSAQHFISKESVDGDSWVRFALESQNKISQLCALVREKVLSDRVTVCGFGASAKSTVWINACGFKRSEIDFIVDCTPSKQGKFSPGNDIPILPERDLINKFPDYAIMFAWNYRDEIIRNNQSYLAMGGRFIIPDRRIDIVQHPVGE
jgi:hypothetical protein